MVRFVFNILFIYTILVSHSLSLPLFTHPLSPVVFVFCSFPFFALSVIGYAFLLLPLLFCLILYSIFLSLPYCFSSIVLYLYRAAAAGPNKTFFTLSSSPSVCASLCFFL